MRKILSCVHARFTRLDYADSVSSSETAPWDAARTDGTTIVGHPFLISAGVIGMGIRILVIEDEPPIADFLVRGLREEGFTVEHAAEGASAWHALHTSEWDLVLLDWWLPVADGLTLLRRYRQAGHTTPVLFLTARDAVSDRVRGLDTGADDYLCKPFAFDELLARIRALTRRHERGTDATLSYVGVRLDLATQRAERSGQRLDLTAKEQALLVLFLRHPGEVLSRTRIYEQVWDERYDGLSNTLEVHIMELRRKLEAHGPRLIHTRRGRGYVFEEPS
jgi:two-component system, OmpR family, copper resistance phosphate regulon response regulator CusR